MLPSQDDGSPTAFHDRMAELTRRLADAAPNGRLPGEASARQLDEARRAGVRVRTATLDSIAGTAANLDLPWRP